MSSLYDVVVDNFPPVSGLSIPLAVPITVTFSIPMSTSGLADTIFVEGPDTDQYIGPGLIELQYPDNISQGPVDDFLRSPGYQGIVEGTFSFDTTIGGGTIASFQPNKPMYPSTTYTAHIVDSLDANGDMVSGHYTWSFETGTGSIQALPNTISTSALAQAFRSPGLSPAAINEIGVLETTPKDHSVQNSQYLEEIDIKFDKTIDPTSVTKDMIKISAEALSSHPNITVSAQGDVTFEVTVSGQYLKLKI